MGDLQAVSLNWGSRIMPLEAEMGSAVSRSSLERMLDAIRLRDERPEGVPPALPSRPTSRGRLPSSRKPLPPRFMAGGDLQDLRSVDSQKWEEKLVLSESGKFGIKGVLRVERPLYVKMPELQRFEKRVEGTEGLDSPAAMLPGVKLGLDDKYDCVPKKIAVVDDTRNQTSQRDLCIEACRHFQELKKGAITLQSFIRGERARNEFDNIVKRWKAVVCIQKHAKRWIARKAFVDQQKDIVLLQSVVRGERARSEFDNIVKRWKAVICIQKHVKRWISRKAFADQQKDIILLQSVIRGWLARRHFIVLKNLEMQKLNHAKVEKDPGDNLSEMKDTNNLEELQTRVLQTEASLKQKEEENIMLRQKIRQNETRWFDYEAKMKTMEECWQKQLTSLQMSLTAAKKSLVANDASSPNDNNYDSEDTTSVETHTTQGTPNTQLRMLSRNPDGPNNAVSPLLEEFKQQSKTFENEAGFLTDSDMKPRKSGAAMNSFEELRELKLRVSAWTKDYKIRLSETKAALQKSDNSKSSKSRKKWWGTSCTR